MYKTALFMGCTTNPADYQFNEWIKTKQNVEILEFRYQQARYGYHSICILYKEK